jgi:hypothetical protein
MHLVNTLQLRYTLYISSTLHSLGMHILYTSQLHFLYTLQLRDTSLYTLQLRDASPLHCTAEGCISLALNS